MFKFTTIPGKDLEKIRLMKGGSQISRDFEMTGGQVASTFTFPHETYTLTTKDLKNTGSFKPVLSGMRVIEAGNDNFNTIYDLNKTETGSEPHQFMDKHFLKEYEAAFNSILGTQMEEDNYEVRTLKVPSLHIEALWLHKADHPDEDQFLPVRMVGKPLENRLYSQAAFLEALSVIDDRYEAGSNPENTDMLGG